MAISARKRGDTWRRAAAAAALPMFVHIPRAADPRALPTLAAPAAQEAHLPAAAQEAHLPAAALELTPEMAHIVARMHALLTYSLASGMARTAPICALTRALYPRATFLQYRIFTKWRC